MYCTDTCCRPENEGPTVTFDQTRVHRAKTEHPCFYGRDTIQPGEQYVRRVLVVDGDFESLAWHASCEYEVMYGA